MKGGLSAGPWGHIGRRHDRAVCDGLDIGRFGSSKNTTAEKTRIRDGVLYTGVAGGVWQSGKKRYSRLVPA